MPDSYFRRTWNEPRGDRLNSWGRADYLFVADDSGLVVEQYEIYEDGHMLAYDSALTRDEFGGLTDQRLDLEEFAPYRISRNEFDAAIGGLRPSNRSRPATEA